MIPLQPAEFFRPRADVFYPLHQPTAGPCPVSPSYSRRRRAGHAGAGAADPQPRVVVRLVAGRPVRGGGLALRHLGLEGGQPLDVSVHDGQPLHLPGGSRLAVRREGDGQFPAGRRPADFVCRGPHLGDRLPDEALRGHRFPAAQNRGQGDHLPLAQRAPPAVVAAAGLEAVVPQVERSLRRCVAAAGRAIQRHE